MYVVVRIMKVTKNHQEEVIKRFLNKNLMSKSPGYIKSLLLLDSKGKDYDVFRQEIFWKDKRAFFVWEGSPEHIAMHKNKTNHSKPEEIIEVSRETYEVVGEI
ncbi:antibiotic biosynthesis monooxygenase family protein [Acholeplasma granularum]|uniref:antibiotic biosynthesis monooxygenase family protein n=1 Tax=Acholeplasma granularum TaxID=264635 RepID=UPI0004B2C553|nr:antibiotic biosynthesis monooxygenase [Acholeplasma granularum]